MSDSVRPHRRQPARLPRPWDSPGKNTGAGCHFLLQCTKVKSEVAQSCPTLSDLMDGSLRGSSVHRIFQAKEYWSGLPLPSLESKLRLFNTKTVRFVRIICETESSKFQFVTFKLLFQVSNLMNVTVGWK